MGRVTYVYKSSIVYPFVDHEIEKKQGFFSISNEMCEVIAYVEKYGLLDV